LNSFATTKKTGRDRVPHFLLRIEGVDFATTLTDTDDLSTIRGASQAYLFMPWRIAELLREATKWQVAPVVVAASFGMFRVAAPDGVGIENVERALADAIGAPVDEHSRLDRVRPHLSFTWAAAEADQDFAAANGKLTARARRRQLQRLTVDVPPRRPTAYPCRFDRRRPGYDSAFEVRGMPQRASDSVKVRHEYGKNERRAFYDPELDWTRINRATFNVTQSLQDIVDAQRSDLDELDRVQIPLALSSKLAVVYFDGNKFTPIREQTIFGGDVPEAEKEDRFKEFDALIRRNRRELLTRVVECLSRDGHYNWVYRDGDWRLRFETLLWGGDESLIVLPAWSLMEVLPELMAALEGWVWQEDYTLSHAVGIAICNVKTPIAVARKLAEDIANAAKHKEVIGADYYSLANVVSMQIFESVEPPREDLRTFRQELYGTGNPRPFTLKGLAELEKMLDLIRAFQDEKEGLPRSQLYGLIAEAREANLFDPTNAAAAERFIKYDPPPGHSAPPGADRVRTVFGRANCEGLLGHLENEALGHSKEAPLLPLIRLAELWDYVDPFGPRTGRGEAVP
jgi:hypothetical protein